ncbi:hypothetical protein [Pseudomonas aeruginosa]|uniref:hypothetical protein n=1 Tax=Pseudomonas aeruginosa TaxID=287 RepID=UPI00093B6755|nr:hypothetical protein [Pseudomonas aeruginosa]
MKITKSEQFENVVSRVGEFLLANFPTPVDFDATVAGYEKVGNADWSKPSQFGEPTETKPSADELFFLSCMQWLHDEAYVRVNQFYTSCDIGVDRVVLTEKGLVMFGALPPCLKPGFHS